MKRRVLIIDPIPVFRLGVSAMLAADPAIVVVGNAATAAEALPLVRRQRPHLILLGLCGGTMADERANLAMLTKGNPPYEVLVLAPRASAEHAKRSMQAGAAGCLPKRIAPEALLEAMKQILAGGSLASSSAETAVRKTHGRHLSVLTPRERSVLDLASKGLVNREIATRLHISTETAKVHMRNILSKLGFSNRIEAAVWVHSHTARARAGARRPVARRAG